MITLDETINLMMQISNRLTKLVIEFIEKEKTNKYRFTIFATPTRILDPNSSIIYDSFEVGISVTGENDLKVDFFTITGHRQENLIIIKNELIQKTELDKFEVDSIDKNVITCLAKFRNTTIKISNSNTI